MAISEIVSNAAALIAPGKGILAADESLPTIGKRFAALDIPQTEEKRRSYRELLFQTKGLSEYISGTILFDETTSQRTSIGESLPGVILSHGIIPGVKVDRGTEGLPNFPGDKFTMGLDGLRERLLGYRELGARFTKWRAVIGIGTNRPSQACLEANAHGLAVFAALSQQAGLVPIVEPEVLMEGPHPITRCEEITRVTLNIVFAVLLEHRVVLEAMLLKTGMVLPGSKAPEQVADFMIADATLRCLRSAVPASVPGIVFLSGGQKDVVATRRLNAICRSGDTPWRLSFSFGRALQDAAMAIWKGCPANAAQAQAALLHRAKCNSLAVQGKYSEQVEADGGLGHDRV